MHALQDQHFDLRRINRLSGGHDARVAATAAIEGHASLLLGAPPVAKLGTGSRLARFLALEHGFDSTVGLRLAADLHNLGGTPAVRSALRRFPASTEQVFHLDKFLQRERPVPIVLPREVEGLRLGSTGTFGELDLRALLAVFGVPRLDGAASGWGGGRSGVYRDSKTKAVLVTLDWDSEVDATEWKTAVEAYVGAAFGTEFGPSVQRARAGFSVAGQSPSTTSASTLCSSFRTT